MLRIALPIMLALAGLPALAVDGNGDFVPRLISAIDDYMSAHQVCLVRTIGSYPVAHESPEQIATASIASCRKSDPAVRAATKRVQAFPSVSNFMDGTSERIVAFSVRLAKARIARH